MASVATCWLEWRGEDIRCGACAGVLAVVWEGGMKAGVVAKDTNASWWKEHGVYIRQTQLYLLPAISCWTN